MSNNIILDKIKIWVEIKYEKRTNLKALVKSLSYTFFLIYFYNIEFKIKYLKIIWNIIFKNNF